MQQENVNIFMDWLTQNANDGPRLCEVGPFFEDEFCKQLVMAVRQVISILIEF